MKPDIKDLILRFILGGGAVAACYIVLQLLPWKSFAGIFAAFPAVMVAAVIMAGISKGSQHAADIALGATAGMLGCTVCVIAAMILMNYLNTWFIAIMLSLLTWLLSSIIFISLINGFLKKRK
ncbi:DUF3147 family protein [Desulfolucanica intricata]|uniref:DUF3147 family protein n=1 Tax=Desulfolucanica intricata TaxID=1285191 RepID=UPI0008378BB1|nr:DUF3147 family protein [Desulfolucanica intricata]